MQTLASARVLEYIRDIPDHYQLYLVDQFGVLHDGHSAFPGARDALLELKSRGAAIVVLSNSGKRAARNAERLNALGFDENCFDAVVTSGEVAWHLLSASQDEDGTPAALGTTLTLPNEARCHLIANDGDTSAADGLSVILVDSIEQADVVLLTGFHGDQAEVDALVKRLEAAMKRDIPCICTNPDKLAYTPNGSVFSAGFVADIHASAGGRVICLGKPYPEIYKYAMNRFGDPPVSQVRCIGDSIEHDIGGGSAIGADTLLIKSGIYRHLDEIALQAVCVEHECAPTFVMPRFGG